ncbi:hypothetical protein Q5752_003041 [Cryptotrichosporon argae]
MPSSVWMDLLTVGGGVGAVVKSSRRIADTYVALLAARSRVGTGEKPVEVEVEVDEKAVASPSRPSRSPPFEGIKTGVARSAAMLVIAMAAASCMIMYDRLHVDWSIWTVAKVALLAAGFMAPGSQNSGTPFAVNDRDLLHFNPTDYLKYAVALGFAAVGCLPLQNGAYDYVGQQTCWAWINGILMHSAFDYLRYRYAHWSDAVPARDAIDFRLLTAFTVAVPGMLIALNMRYDRLAASSRADMASTSAAMPRLATPAVYGLVVARIWFAIVGRREPWLLWVPTTVSSIAVVATSAVHGAMSGQLWAWWTYEEQWTDEKPHSIVYLRIF